jgi:sulfate permease, SulP family
MIGCAPADPRAHGGAGARPPRTVRSIFHANVLSGGRMATRGRAASTWRTHLPVLQGLLPLRRGQVAGDLVAGATLAALAIPEVMGYTRIAGTPVVTGLYTLLLPAVLFALFGSSRHLVVGADSATAAIMAGSLVALAHPGTPQWLALAGVLALMCAALLLVARLARLAFLADFLSRTVLVGFLTGVGVQVALGELPGVLGIAAQGDGTLRRFWSTVQQWPSAHAADAAIGIGVIALILLVRKWAPRFPVALLAVLAALGLSWWLDLPHHGVAVVGALQGGLPGFTWPALQADWGRIGQLAPAAVAMSIVILAQSAATSRAYAWKYDEPFDEDADLVGLGLANLGAALTGTFVVNGSPTKTEMVDAAGGRSQLAHLAMSVVVLLVLLFFTAPIAWLPEAALSGVVFVIGIDLVHLRDLRSIHAVRPSEFWVAVITAVAVLVLGVEHAIMLAMLLSLIDHTRRGYRPHNTVLARGEHGQAKPLPVASAREYAPGLMIYRFNHAMYYANVEALAHEVNALLAAARPPLRWFVLDMDAVDDVDYSAAAALTALRKTTEQAHVQLKFLRLSPSVADELRRYGLLPQEAQGDDAFEAVDALERRFAATAAPAGSGSAADAPQPGYSP